MTVERQLYVIFGEGTARGHDTAPDGQVCKLVMMQRAISPEDAHRTIAGHLWNTGWINWRFDEVMLFDPEAPLPESDEVAKAAYREALRGGSAIIYYPPVAN